MQPPDIQRFYSVHAKFYDVTRPLFLPGRKKAVAALDVREGDTVLDFACGTGMNLPFLIRSKAARIIGIDFSADMLLRARRKFPRVSLVRADIREFRPGEKADKALCTYALSIIDDWESVLSNIKECLHANGTLVVLDFCPFAGALSPLNGILDGWLKRCGTSAKKPIGEALQRHFWNVSTDAGRWGYSAFWVASGPRVS